MNAEFTLAQDLSVRSPDINNGAIESAWGCLDFPDTVWKSNPERVQSLILCPVQLINIA